MILFKKKKKFKKKEKCDECPPSRIVWEGDIVYFCQVEKYEYGKFYRCNNYHDVALGGDFSGCKNFKI